MGVHTGSEAVRMLGIAFVVFALPAAAGWLIGKVATLNEMLWDFIKS
ncbi:MAG: CD1845 family protein [Lachnospiraceae bacterium]|nr:CD1845 family protein [Lachnospiraceae bacterium]